MKKIIFAIVLMLMNNVDAKVLDVMNEEKVLISNTGDIGVLLITTGVLTLVFGCGILIYLKKQKNNK